MSSDDTPPNGLHLSNEAFIVVVDRLARIETQLQGIRQDRAKIDQAIGDHETRIRKMEERKFPLPTVAVLISLAAVVVTVLQYVTQK
ncbi:hypothetical protein [Streptomyces sp. NPDC055085]